VAADFARLRSGIGAQAVLHWAERLPPGASILDIGCGTGLPIARALMEKGFAVHGIDPAPTLLAAFQRNLPGAPAACEAAETSDFFNRRFDAVIAIGVLFLLPESSQCALIGRVSQALHPGGHFLFTAPPLACRWADSLTGQPSHSLGAARYGELLATAGLALAEGFADEGGNHYFPAHRLTSA
jgi:2-polyprenyl-3-methyl-5-hydroxy-6-metoxy-1,4-benzoquinol methylase